MVGVCGARDYGQITNKNNIMTPNDFISKKENDTGLLFEKWSLTQLCTYMGEYAKLVSSSNDIHDVSYFSDIYVTFDEDDGSVGTAFDNKERAERDAVETCSGLMTMRLIHGK